MFWIRFVMGGLIVALVPTVAKHASPRLAGLLLVMPIIGVVALLFAAQDHNNEIVTNIAQGAIIGLIPLLAFYATIILLNKSYPSLVILTGALFVWLLSASIVSVYK